MIKNKSTALLVCVFFGVLNFFILKYKVFGDSFYLCFSIHIIVFVLVSSLLVMMRKNLKSTFDRISLGIGILFILVNLLLGLGVFTMWNNHRDYNTQGTKIQMKILGEKLAIFKRHCGRFPLTEEGLNALVTKVNDNICKDYPSDGFIEGGKVPLDHWDQDFQYKSDGSTYLLKTQFEKRIFIKTDKSEVYEE